MTDKEKIDIVYPLGTGSIYQDFELRMSLRSVEQHLSGVRNVYIVGEKPEWLTGIIHIPARDTARVSDYNIMKKVELACRNPEVSDNFLFMNDDHYLMADFEGSNFPYLWSRTMEDYIRRRVHDTYRQRVKNSYEYLKSKDLPTKFFDTHYPIVYNKDAFLEHVVEALDWKDRNVNNGFVLKSVYANSMHIEGQTEPDHKTGQVPPPKSIAFSTTPYMRANVRLFLSEKFPKKSRFEGDNPNY